MVSFFIVLFFVFIQSYFVFCLGGKRATFFLCFVVSNFFEIFLFTYYYGSHLKIHQQNTGKIKIPAKINTAKKIPAKNRYRQKYRQKIDTGTKIPAKNPYRHAGIFLLAGIFLPCRYFFAGIYCRYFEVAPLLCWLNGLISSILN